MRSPPLFPIERLWLRTMGGLVIGIAVVVAVGWTAGIQSLVKWVPGDAHMVMNSAVGALVAGAGFVALAAARHRLAAAAGIVLLGFAALNLATEFKAIRLSVARFFWHQPGQIRFNLGGQMSANTAVAFILVGLAILLLALRAPRRGVVATLAGIVGALALLPLLQYSADLATKSGPAAYHGMAIPTSCCLLLLAAALLRMERAASEGALTFMSAALGMLFSIGLIAAGANGDLLEANRSVTQTYQVRSDLARFLEQVARAESAGRGYALTGLDSFRVRASLHEKEAFDLLSSLRPLVAESREQAGRIAGLRSLAEEKFAENDALRRAAQAQGTGGAAEYLRTIIRQPGQPARNLVLLADQVETEEGQVLQSRREVQLALERNTRLVQIAGTVIAVALLAASVLLTRRAAAARREAVAQFRGSFEDAGIGMALVGLDGRWLRVNRSIHEILGYSEAELLQRTFQDITHPEDLKMDLDRLHDLLAGRSRTYQLAKRYRHKDGHVVWGNLTVSLVRHRDGSPAHFISQIEDVTERKRLEEELRTARDDALAATRIKSEFLATMSHEIRTPLNGVIGMVQLLGDSPLNADQREMADTIQSSADGLLRVLNDVLDFSKIEAGKFTIDPEWFELAAVIEETLALYEPQFREKKIRLVRDVAPEIAGIFWGDGGRLRQILSNLIGNALKFTAAGRVTMSVGVAREEAGAAVVRFEVSDTGIGISPEDQGGLFRSFTQVDSSDRRRYGGTGLGLAISKRLVELMGGTIGLSSEADRGSRFWFELPLRRQT